MSQTPRSGLQTRIVGESPLSDTIRTRPAGPELTDGQREMVYDFATSSNKIEVGVGPAGTGKSTALALIRELAANSGTPIVGTALAAKAAVGLQTATGIPSSTLTLLLKDAMLRGLPEGLIVIVDEAGMVGTRQLARLADHVEEVSGKLILVGDPRQLAEIEAGGLFEALATRLPAVHLTENIRQTQEWERTALAELRDGSTDQAFAAYQEKGRVVATDCTHEAVELAVQGWQRDVQAVGDASQVLLIAHRNTTVDRLNQQARRIVEKTGRLRGIPITVPHPPFRGGYAPRIDPRPATARPLILEGGAGDHFRFLNHLATVKVSAGSEGQLSVVEFLAPKGFGPPLHRHNDEDELFVVFEGELMLRSGDTERPCSDGAIALLPRSVPHSFQVLSEEARFLNVTGASAGPPRFDQMVAALGTATEEVRIPSPGPVDPDEVARVCAAHNIDILGPPPPPLP